MVQLLVSVFVETVFETVSINESHLILSFVQCPNHHATKSLNLVWFDKWSWPLVGFEQFYEHTLIQCDFIAHFIIKATLNVYVMLWFCMWELWSCWCFWLNDSTMFEENLWLICLLINGSQCLNC